MTFEKPRILTDSESNTIRGKCLVGRATIPEVMQLIGHFDLVEHELLEALHVYADPQNFVYGNDWVWKGDDDPTLTAKTVIAKMMLW